MAQPADPDFLAGNPELFREAHGLAAAMHKNLPGRVFPRNGHGRYFHMVSPKIYIIDFENAKSQIWGCPYTLGIPVVTDLNRPRHSGFWCQALISDLASIVVPFRLNTLGGILSFLPTTTVFGTPVDVTLSELALEVFFSADNATADALHAIVADRATP